MHVHERQTVSNCHVEITAEAKEFYTKLFPFLEFERMFHYKQYSDIMVG